MRYTDFTKHYIMKIYGVMWHAVHAFAETGDFVDAMQNYGARIEEIDRYSIAIPQLLYDKINSFIYDELVESIKKYKANDFFDDKIDRQFAINLRVLLENFAFKELQPVLAED